MKKSTKLLSVILAIIMIFSTMSIMASAKVASYQKVTDLEASNAYNEYGTVTRLSTEERMSILLDALDNLLAPLTSLNMGYVVNVNLLITKIQLYINLTSVDEILNTLDSASALLEGGWGTIAKGLVDLGIVEEVTLADWNNNHRDMSRSGNNQVDIVAALLATLSANTSAVESVFTNGINLGIIGGFIKGLDLTDINTMIKDLPSAVKSLVYPLFSRADDDNDTRGVYKTASAGLSATLDNFVQGIFSKPMNWTSYREDAAGNDLGYTLALPTDESTSRYFVQNGDTIEQYDYQYTNDNKDYIGTWQLTVTYTKAIEYEGAETYVFKAPDGYTGDAYLKYYSAGDKGYFLPSVDKAMEAGTFDFSFNSSTDSAVSLLYKFIPYVFQEMAPTVLNGSVKKLLAGLFDVTFEKVGVLGDAAVTALASSTGDPAHFFTKDQEFYLWEYSDYKVIDGVPYYRFQDEYFVGSIPSNISTYYYMFDWDWDITDDYINKYIPGVDGLDVTTSDAGYTTILEALNDFVYDVIDTVLVDSFTIKGQTYNLKTGMGWVAGDNSKALDNILRAARYVFNMAPEEIFDEYYDDPDFSPYYDMMINGTLEQAITGILCAVIEMVMPQMILPKADKLCVTVGTNSASDVPFIALGALVVRELCSQLMPSYDFDALIYDDYNTKTLLTGADYDSDYWLDTVLTMGVDLGMFYLRNITDIGEDDTDDGYYAVMKNLSALPSDATADKVTYEAGATFINGVPSWQYKVDWIIDWALSSAEEWCWGFEKLINCGSTVNLRTYENPWNKLNTILLDLLPLDELLNADGATSDSNTFLENILRGKLVGSILDLDLSNLVSMVNIPAGLFRNGNVLNQVVVLVRDLLNGILYKVAGNANIVPTSVTSIETILVQNTIKTIASTLVGKLYTAEQNGLLVPVLPIVNMFIGWKTSAQQYADPNIYFASSSNDNYLLKASTNELKFANNSSGMLEKHRNSSTTDHSYDIAVSNITTDTDGCSVAFNTTPVEPGKTGSYTITTPSGSGVVKFTITYSYTGKDGNPLGGDQTKVCYAYYTETADEEYVEGRADGDDDKEYTGIGTFSKYQFTTDVYKTITEYKQSISSIKPNVGSGKTVSWISVVSDTAPTGLGATYFRHIANQGEGGWPSSIESQSSGSGYLYKSKTTADTFSEKNSIENNLYGVYDMGQIAIKYGYSSWGSMKGDSKVWAIDFIYYNDYDITKVMDKYVGYGLQASNFTSEGQDAFGTYETALKKVVELAEFPKLTTYVDNIQSQIPDAITAIDDAYKALEPYKVTSSSVSASASVTDIKDALAAIETDPAKDIDFEDHALFEYFQYEKQRTSARNMIKACTLPAEPEAYIDGASLSEDAITAVVNAANANVATGINATIVQPTDEAMTAWNTAVAEFVAPLYTDLQIDDQISKLNYYAGFMNENVRTPDKNLLNKEIVAANAQGYVESDYSVDSWEAYQIALTDAVDAYKNATLQSAVFDAKFALMDAQNKLIPADASMKDNGYLDTELNGLIAQAELVVNSFDTYYELKSDVAAADAWAQLVKALGVRYNVTVEGVDYEGILYGHSAYTFTDYDRLNTNKEKAKVDVACDNLKAALANFECKIKVVPNDAITDNTTVVTQSEFLIDGVKPASLTDGSAFKALVKTTAPAGLTATLTETASMTVDSIPFFGTGSKIVLSEATVGTIATYTLVIHGDVNGDGAIDAFDAFEVEKAASGNGTLSGACKIAGDINSDSTFTVADYGAILSAAAGVSELAQVTA